MSKRKKKEPEPSFADKMKMFGSNTTPTPTTPPPTHSKSPKIAKNDQPQIKPKPRKTTQHNNNETDVVQDIMNDIDSVIAKSPRTSRKFSGERVLESTGIEGSQLPPTRPPKRESNPQSKTHLEPTENKVRPASISTLDKLNRRMHQKQPEEDDDQKKIGENTFDNSPRIVPRNNKRMSELTNHVQENRNEMLGQRTVNTNRMSFHERESIDKTDSYFQRKSLKQHKRRHSRSFNEEEEINAMATFNANRNNESLMQAQKLKADRHSFRLETPTFVETRPAMKKSRFTGTGVAHNIIDEVKDRNNSIDIIYESHERERRLLLDKIEHANREVALANEQLGQKDRAMNLFKEDYKNQIHELQQKFVRQMRKVKKQHEDELATCKKETEAKYSQVKSVNAMIVDVIKDNHKTSELDKAQNSIEELEGKLETQTLAYDNLWTVLQHNNKIMETLQEKVTMFSDESKQVNERLKLVLEDEERQTVLRKLQEKVEILTAQQEKIHTRSSKEDSCPNQTQEENTKLVELSTRLQSQVGTLIEEMSEKEKLCQNLRIEINKCKTESQPLQDRIKELEGKINELETREKQKMKALKDEIDTLTADLEKANEATKSSKDELSKLNTDMKGLDEKILEVQKELEEQMVVNKEQLETIAAAEQSKETLKAAYENLQTELDNANTRIKNMVQATLSSTKSLGSDDENEDQSGGLNAGIEAAEDLIEPFTGSVKFSNEQAILEARAGLKNLVIKERLVQDNKNCSHNRKIHFGGDILWKTALENGDISELKIQLEKYNHDINNINDEGVRPLHVVSCEGHSEAAQFLIDNGAEVNCVDKDNWTPLHCAACTENIDLVEVLLQGGSDFRIKSFDGETAYELCEDEECRELLKSVEETVLKQSRLRSMYEYVSNKDDELDLKKGTIVNIDRENAESSDWVMATNEEGKSGFIPFNYLTFITLDDE